jgi:hypothetical protein
MSATERTIPLPEFCHVLLGVATDRRIGSDWPAPPEELLRRYGASEERIRALAARPHIRTVPSVAPLQDAATIALDTRREAVRMADLHDGIVLDLAVPRIVPTGEPDLAMASQWVAFDLVDQSITSIGLATFGLPEMAWDGTRGAISETVAVLTGLAHRLIAEWPANDPVGPATVTLADIAAGLGDVPAPRDRGIELNLGYDGKQLVISAHDDPRSLFA